MKIIFILGFSPHKSKGSSKISAGDVVAGVTANKMIKCKAGLKKIRRRKLTKKIQGYHSGFTRGTLVNKRSKQIRAGASGGGEGGCINRSQRPQLKH